MVLNLLNLYSLIFALFNEIEKIDNNSVTYKSILSFELAKPTESEDIFTSTALSTITSPLKCHLTGNCSSATLAAVITSTLLSIIASTPSPTITTIPPSPYADLISTNSFLTTFSNLYTTQTTNFTDDFLTELTTVTTRAPPETTLPIEYSDEDKPYFYEEPQNGRKKRQFFAENYLDENTTDLYYSDYEGLLSTLANEISNSTENSTVWNVTDYMALVTERLAQILTTTIEPDDYTDEERDYITAISKTFSRRSTTTEPSTTITTTDPTTMFTTMPTMMFQPTENALMLPPNQTAIDYADKQIRRLCWETMFGQELVKLTVMDLVNKFIRF